MPAGDLHFDFETSRFRNFCQFVEGFGFGKFCLEKVLVLVLKKIGLGKKSRFRKKVSVSVSENLVSEK